MSAQQDTRVRWIPISQITVLNPRERGKKKFAQITANIAKLGLKRPVTVAVAEPRDGEPRYDLTCGQGRLEAFRALGQTEIPALVVNGTREDQHVRSLAENLARRQHTADELLRAVRVLKDSGYSPSEIARKIDLDTSYVSGVLKLLDRGETRLLQAVESGQLPITIAITIATADDRAVQRAIQEAYERNTLRGKALLRARRLVEKHRAGGKKLRHPQRPAADRAVSADTLLRTFHQETTRQKLVVQKARICETRLLFAVSAVRQLLQDEHFVTLLRAEGLDSLPQYLADQVKGGAS